MTDPAIDKINGTDSVHSTKVAEDRVIDLREAPTRVRVARDDNPFTALSPPERMKLIIRVLCEIVAYGEIDEDAPTPEA